MPQAHTCGIMWKNAGIYKMCHRSGPVEIMWKNSGIYKMCHGSGPVELCKYF